MGGYIVDGGHPKSEVRLSTGLPGTEYAIPVILSEVWTLVFHIFSTKVVMACDYTLTNSCFSAHACHPNADETSQGLSQKMHEQQKTDIQTHL